MTAISQKTIPKGWKKVQFVDCIDLSSLKKLKGLKKSEYKNDGKYLILDQGQDFISGYTDDEKFVNKKCPAILFGDHTRIIKFINFPFVAGADGTKIFQSKKEINPKFLYYSLLNLDIPNTGYNRHFKLVKESKILLPPLTEQIKIVEILLCVDSEIEKTDQVIKKTEKFKKGLMQELLDRSKNLKIVKFSQLVKMGKDKISPKEVENQRYIGLEHIGQGSGLLLGSGNSEETQSIKTIFKKGDILFGKLRPYLKKYWKAEFDGVCTTEILVFRPILNNDTDFIFQLIQSDKFIQHSISKSFGTKMPRTDWKIISEFKIKIPSPEERKKIAEILSAIDSKINIDKQIKNKLAVLKKGFMQDLLGGRVRVKK
ncbi:restriction endonuclease subunit S [Patescibacteria group bacterium]|nr:restriction endonuclease subunit S [Patescibacteria group bacterium]MBU1663145.1 restriction endonuclease subunit S [Patescibacteria group bacterium]MBU1934077.1 restriction endonuclease subunit S [Patescibacteria group bacterium]MBU2008094.1 restriction endonuclease subunit S [Patescibacteria group bacterium]MBU2233411.1 restriction endonuclease subunit S [Patescibacteria group bacterium]